MGMKNNRLLLVVLFLSALASSLYLLVLGYYALPVADDLGWARQVEDLNPFGFVKMMFMGWQGRYSAIFVDGILCRCLGWNEHLLGFTIVELLLGYGAVYLLLRDMLIIREGGLLLALSVTVTNLGIMSFPELGTFFWLCTSNYVHEIWVTLYLVWLVFCCQRRWLQWIGVLLCSVYLGGCSENYPPVVISILGVVLLYKMVMNKEWRFWRYREQSLVFVSIIVISVGFFVMLFAPGNAVRLSRTLPADALMNHFNLGVFTNKLIKASVVIFLRLLSRGWFFLCAFPLFVYLGAMAHRTIPKISLKRFLLSLGIMIGVLVLSVAVMIYGLGWYATMRANCFMVFIVLVWVAYIGVLTGMMLKDNNRSRIVLLSSMAVIITSLSFIAKEYPIVKKYHHDVVEIHHQMGQYVAEGRTDAVVIYPVFIPYRQSSYGYLRNFIQVLIHKSKRYNEQYFPYEPFKLDADPSNWMNQFYKSWLNAQFDIACFDEELDK